jgi:hypothetical protein
MAAKNVFLVLILTFILTLFLRHRVTGHTIFTLNPTAEVDKLTAFRTEGTNRIVFPLDWLTAGWTVHESLTPRNGAHRLKEMRVV